MLATPLAGMIPARRRSLALTGIKAIHTLIFFSIAAAVGLTVWDGVRGRPRRRTALAAGIVASESVVYLSNNQVCPLTPLAERLGARSGSVVDIFLPARFARRIPLIAGSASVLALVLNLRALQARGDAEGKQEAMSGSVPLINRLLARTGWVPILTVRGRRSGRPRRVPVAPVEYRGARYLVALRGQTDWARNLAAAEEGELFGRGRAQEFRAVEVTGGERRAVARAYQQAFGRWMKGLGPMPDADGQRVFRIAPLESVRAA